jgi:hypothetical protein
MMGVMKGGKRRRGGGGRGAFERGRRQTRTEGGWRKTLQAVKRYYWVR